MSILPAWSQTLRFQISAALLLLVGLFCFSTLYSLQVLEAQRDDDRLLQLAGRLEPMVQQLAMQAMNYKANAPRDYPTYYRDLELYYQDLMTQRSELDGIIRAFESGSFADQDMPDPMAQVVLAPATHAAARKLAEFWNGYGEELDRTIGDNKEEPRLEWAAEYVMAQKHGLRMSVDELLRTLEADLNARHDRAHRLSRLVLIGTLVFAIGVFIWFLLRVLRPLNLAVAGFQRVATGDFSHQVEIQRNDEIGWLAMAFNQLTRRLGTIFQLSTELQRGGDLNETLGFVAREVPALLPLDWVGALFVGEDGQVRLERAYADGELEQSVGTRFALAGTLLRECLETGEPLHVGDVRELALLEPHYHFLRQLDARGRRDAIFLPVTDYSPVPVVLVFASRRAHAYSGEHQELLKNLSLLMALSFGRTVRLAQHAQLAAVGQFASGVAHEIRTPLATLSLALDYFAQANLPESARKRADLARGEVTRMGRLLEEMLLYAKPLQLRHERLDLAELFRDLVATHAEWLRQRRQELVLTVDATEVVVDGDRDRLTQLFLNLIRNGSDAAPPDSEISVNLSDSGQRELMVRVRNPGEPIPPERLDKLFEPFFTTKASGTGLGLAIVRRLVDVHGGRIEVNSDAAAGTCFAVALPLAEEEGEAV